MKCPCCSNKIFDKCCAKFLVHGAKAKTPEKLMRSRYSAIALGEFNDYLLATGPAYDSSDDVGKEGLAELLNEDKGVKEDQREWVLLELIDKSQKGDEAIVEFKAFYTLKNSPDAEKQYVQHERSRFERSNGEWHYTSGSIQTKS